MIKPIAYDKDSLIALLQRDALRTGTFTLASGRSSHYYVDGRKVTLSAEGAALIGAGVMDLLKDYPQVSAVGGLTMGADPIVGATLATALGRGRPDLKGFLVRKETKSHGTGKLVEGPLEPGSTVAIIDDVATTGGSSLKAVEAVQTMGCNVALVIAVLDRLEGAEANFHKEGLTFKALTNIRDLGVEPLEPFQPDLTELPKSTSDDHETLGREQDSEPRMETSLHRQLKEYYADNQPQRIEVLVDGLRIDALNAEGDLVEIQSGAVGPLKSKLRRLLPQHVVRIIKPIPISRRIVRRQRRLGPDISARLSPKRGSVLDLFDDLLGLVRVFPHPNLFIDLLEVDIDEVRLVRRRWPRYTTIDRRLRNLGPTKTLRTPDDLWSLLPTAWNLPAHFTTKDLAQAENRPLWFAQRVAYCLRETGAARVVGKHRHSRLYEHVDTSLVGHAS